MFLKEVACPASLAKSNYFIKELSYTSFFITFFNHLFCNFTTEFVRPTCGSSKFTVRRWAKERIKNYLIISFNKVNIIQNKYLLLVSKLYVIMFFFFFSFLFFLFFLRICNDAFKGTWYIHLMKLSLHFYGQKFPTSFKKWHICPHIFIVCQIRYFYIFILKISLKLLKKSKKTIWKKK